LPRRTEAIQAPAIATREQRCVCCGSAAREPVGSARDFEYETCANEFLFVRCLDCGHHYLRDVPEPEELSRIYPEHYGNYEAGRSESLTFRVKGWLDRRWLRALAADGPMPRSVLDVGCADGRMLELCRAVFSDLERLEGVEISERAARAARCRGHAVRVGTIEEIELPAETYDLILLQQVIEHLYAPDRVCRVLARALRPGGRVVFETPTTESLDFRLFRRRYWGGYHVPRHFHLWSEASLRRLCADAGLEWVETSYRPQPIHWAWTMHHYLREHGWPAAIYGQFHIQNAPVMAAFTLVELAAGMATRRMSNMRLVARRPRDRRGGLDRAPHSGESRGTGGGTGAGGGRDPR